MSITRSDADALPLSQHARVRMQQRGLPPEAVDLIHRYGRRCHDHQGCARVFLDRRGREAIRRQEGEGVYRSYEKAWRAYLVERVGGAVLTAGYRTRRFLQA